MLAMLHCFAPRQAEDGLLRGRGRWALGSAEGDIYSSLAALRCTMASLPDSGSVRASSSKDPPNPVFCHSTPQKNKLICPYCFKVYQVKFYYDLHLTSHQATNDSTSTPNNNNLNGSLAIQLDASVVSAASVSFRVPNVPKKKVVSSKPKPKPKYLCTYCLKGYLCQRSFKTHVRTHVIQDAASRYPDRKKFLENCQNLAIAALTKVAEAPSYGNSGHIFHQLVGHVISIPKETWKQFAAVLCKEMTQELLKKKTLLPSALLVTLFNSVESILSNTEMCNNFLSILDIPKDLSGNSAHQFFLEFVLQFAQLTLSFICETFLEGRRLPQKPPREIDDEDRQVIYYVSGSVMRGYIRMAYRYKTASWQEIAKVIKDKVLRDKPTKEDEKDAGWTLNRDRGGLLYVSSEAKEFFISLTEVVFDSEQKDGSIIYEDVIRKVSDSPICDKWDAIIGNALKEKTSLNLMNDVIRSYCRTCASGFAKRRLNFLKAKPVISMPTRHAVARRKK